jgi:RHS repeat-associated protein
MLGKCSSCPGITNAGDLQTLNHTLAGTASDYTFTYTNAHELLSEANTASNFVWQPPANASTTYVPNNLNQYASVGGISYAYDPKGNLTSDGTFAYSYDAENRLLTAAKSGLSASYSYDPLGRRTMKAAAGAAQPTWGSFNWGAVNWTAASTVTTYFLDSGSDEIAEYNGSGSLTTRYVPGPAIDKPIAMVTSGGTKTFFHTNKQGSTIATSDTGGALAEGPYTYDPYGNCFSNGTACSSIGEPYRFTGQRLDSETGCYYYRARIYCPSIGRFLQTDPVGYKADLNLYAYAGNDPTDKDDTLGLESAEISLYSSEVDTQGRKPDIDSLPGARTFDTEAKVKTFAAMGGLILLAQPELRTLAFWRQLNALRKTISKITKAIQLARGISHPSGPPPEPPVIPPRPPFTVSEPPEPPSAGSSSSTQASNPNTGSAQAPNSGTSSTGNSGSHGSSSAPSSSPNGSGLSPLAGQTVHAQGTRIGCDPSTSGAGGTC